MRSCLEFDNLNAQDFKHSNNFLIVFRNKMRRYYRDEPPTPTPTSTNNDNFKFLVTDTNRWPTIERPSNLMPLKAALRTHSATGTTNSSMSDLRTPVRFSDPLAHYIDYTKHHPSVYLREQNGDGEIRPQRQKIFSEFNVGTKNSVRQVSLNKI